MQRMSLGVGKGMFAPQSWAINTHQSAINKGRNFRKEKGKKQFKSDYIQTILTEYQDFI